MQFPPPLWHYVEFPWGPRWSSPQFGVCERSCLNQSVWVILTFSGPYSTVVRVEVEDDGKHGFTRWRCVPLLPFLTHSLNHSSILVVAILLLEHLTTFLLPLRAKVFNHSSTSVFWRLKTRGKRCRALWALCLHLDGPNRPFLWSFLEFAVRCVWKSSSLSVMEQCTLMRLYDRTLLSDQKGTTQMTLLSC